MSKNVLVVHCSPRKNGNSSMLADEFIRGAKEAGNEVTRIDVGNCKISGCLACEHCVTHEGECVQDDEMQQFYPLLQQADTLVYAAPLYFYSQPAQMRTFEDRTYCQNGKHYHITQEVLLMTLADETPSSADGAVESFRKCADYCKREVAGVVVAAGVYEKGAIAGHPALEQAYNLGLSIK